ncbi:MAG: hypothetical protein ABR588_05720 [Sphingomicrobium sp.]|nr:hypothetical protein [Sphingomonadales bacterium]
MRNDLWTAWRTMMRAGTMMRETIDASHHVVEVRGEAISAAMSDPLHADQTELALMVNEKTEAFALAGAALTSRWLAMQSDLAAQALAVGGLMVSGRLPGRRAARAMVARQRRIGYAAAKGSIAALQPIHAAATANARRLKR